MADPFFIHTLSLHFNGHFPGGPGLAGTRMSPLLELRMTEMAVTTEAIRCAKLQSNRHHQQTSIQFFTSQMHFLSPNQQFQSTEGRPFIHYEPKQLGVVWYDIAEFNVPLDTV